MSTVLFDPMFTGLTRVLDLRQQQHALTATNIANADTPGFQAKVLDFADALKSAVQPAPSGSGAAGDRALMQQLSTLDAPVRTLEAPPWSVDGNSVQPEREMARLQENALMYKSVAGGLSRRLAMLKYAASDGS
jgi:flagellar basal-body rod protein FlgB